MGILVLAAVVLIAVTAVGVVLVLALRRRPPGGPEADYDDLPPVR